MTRTKMHSVWAALLLGSGLVTSAVPVTFQVNMDIQAAVGRFDPVADSVEVRGSFNAWGGGFTLAPSPANPKIYQGVFDASEAPGSQLQYKFVINTAASGLVWEGINNRTFLLAESTQTLDIVFFNNLAINPGTGTPVTYQVNMAIQIAMGAFDPAADIVEARGPFNNWGGGFTLTNSPSNPSLYRGTFNDKTSAPGSPVPHKFVIVRPAGDVVWESGNDRTYTLTSSAQTVPVAYFNRIEPTDPGPVTVASPSGGKLKVSWNGRAGVYLQSTTDVAGGKWQDVADTDGQSSKEFTVGAGAVFFRLASLSQ